MLTHRAHALVAALALALAAPLAACGDDDDGATPDPVTEPEPEPIADEEEPPEPEVPEADPNEACARVIVVSYEGAEYAPEDMDRSKELAEARAEELHTHATHEDATFSALAREESDAASSGPRGGLIGTYMRDDWPEAHAAIMEPVFELGIGEVSDVIEAPYGYVIAQRCPVEKIHTRHILVRYQGARNAPEDVTRSETEAQALADQLRSRIVDDGEDFEAVAREASEDASAERGGDLGEVGRGILAPEYEGVAFGLAPGTLSQPVRTEFGYHVIERLE